MKSGLCCLLLLFVAAQARDLSAYGSSSGHHDSSHHTQDHYTDCRKEVGYKIVAKDPKCGNTYCKSGHYCKTLKEVDCKYYSLESCPKYGFRYYTCEPIYIACGKSKCHFGYKCGKKKVCSTDKKEYDDGHKTTVETKKCWYEDACVKEDPPLVCSYDGNYKKCYVDPKYAAIAAGVACGHAKCPPGHKCVGACKVCKYEVVAYPYCESVSHYTPIPCGSGVCNPYQTCAVSERTVCKKSGSGGYTYYPDGRHASNPGKYSYYEMKEGYTETTYYYSGTGGQHHGTGGHHSTGHSASQGSHRNTGTASHRRNSNAGGSRKSPSPTPSPSPPPPPPPPPPPVIAGSQSTSVSTPTGTTANSAIVSQNGGVAGSNSQASNLNSFAASFGAFDGARFQAGDVTASNNNSVTARANIAANIQRTG